MVPHENLFAKLSRFGVRGCCLAFIKALYANTYITVRVGAGSTAQYSSPKKLCRGIRQGCPLSPVLFNIFINDILDGCPDDMTVIVPTGTKAEWLESPIQVGGALFADDAVTLAPSIEAQIAFCGRITTWTDNNKMKVGIMKCGCMEILADQDRPPVLTDEHPL